jgi:ParB-like chromosome segregation protein Spo0J
MLNANYQVMRALTESEYNELKESIIQSGVIISIVLDEDGNILDGYHRKQICDELGITDYPVDIQKGLSEEEKISLAYKLNEARRQLTPEEKRQEIKRRLPLSTG